MQRNGMFQPILRIIEPVGQQANAAQSENCLKVFGISSGDLRVNIASFGELPGLEELIGRINARLPWLRFRLFCKTAMRDDQGKRHANAGTSHVGFAVKPIFGDRIISVVLRPEVPEGFCVGCCWALMLFAWVGGAMNLMWMLAVTAFLSMEKLLGVLLWLLPASAISLLGAPL
jgi:hypothetical protein